MVGSWSVLPSLGLPLVSSLFSLSLLLCGTCRLCSFQLSGVLYRLELNKRKAIFRLVSYRECFWDGVKECTISKPLVKFLLMVDGDKPVMGYLYEAMDRAKEAIHAYYEDKGDEGQAKQQLI